MRADFLPAIFNSFQPCLDRILSPHLQIPAGAHLQGPLNSDENGSEGQALMQEEDPGRQKLRDELKKEQDGVLSQFLQI